METPDTILALPRMPRQETEIDAVMGCLLGNLRTIFALRILVNNATLSDDERASLTAGIDHLEHHVVGEAKSALATQKYRNN